MLHFSLQRISPGVFLCAALFFGAAGAAFSAEEKVQFNRDIRPILSEHCFTCHGQDSGARKSELRLDQREAALHGGESGDPAIVAGKPDDSEVMKRVVSTDRDEVMPPPKAKNPLKPAEIEKLRRWIGEGAEYQAHWAFIPPQRPALPAGANGNAIDALIGTRLAAAGMQPSPPAPPETLCRRLWLDLVGLPPSPAELDEFLQAWAKDHEAAYLALIDRLLASPRYGEKWARHWLDAARYADSDGYEKDLPRQQWAWRDWVVNALNADKPYDRFLVEQIAGDLLPHAGQDEMIATGFLRNSMVSEEGAILAEQYRMDEMFDRMDCLGKAVLGLTVQCAQCHSHKFDPLTQEEYYRMMASLNNTYEATSRVYSAEKLAKITDIRMQIADAEWRLQGKHPDWKQRLADWAAEQKAKAIPWNIVTPLEPEWGGGLAHPEVLPDKSVLTLGFRPSDGDLTFTANEPLEGCTGLRIEALNHRDLIFGGPGRSVYGLFAVSELTIETQLPGEKEWKKVTPGTASADFESPDRPIGEAFRKGDKEERRVGPAAMMIDGKKETAWSPDRGPGRRNTPYEAVIQFKEPLHFPAGTKLRVQLSFHHAGVDPHGRNNNFLGRFRVALTTANAPVAAPIAPDVRAALDMPEEQRTPEQQAKIFSAWRATVPEFSEANTQIEKLWAQYPEPDTTVLHLNERSAEDARATFILDRGAWDKPKKQVTPGVPVFLHAAPASEEPPRLVFARWLADRTSPTTARVEVNRVWQAIFGTGLVETPEDFGVRATEPLQRDVLDWLAVDFMDHGWSQKRLIRAIVSSETYRQSSRATPELLERDPRNRYLARGPRFRADAEVVRDIALRASGLLNETRGGPTIFPPMPDSILAGSYLEIDFWKTAVGADRYRRSLYMFRRRSMPDPVLASFDAPNGDSACPRREHSNTPLAALASLNEPVFVEAARALALRVLREGGATDTDRASYAFRLCTARTPKPAEVADLIELLQSRRARLSEGWLSVRELTTGDANKLPDLPPHTTPVDAAAWTIASRVLLNLDETLTKN